MAMAASFQAPDCPETPKPFTKLRSLPLPLNSADTAIQNSPLPALKPSYSKTCLKRNAIVPVFFSRFHRFPFYKGLCFNKTKYKKYDRLGLQ